MYAKYPQDGVFVLPAGDEVIWRYMDLAKFLSALDRESLFFCRADLLGDLFEGSYPRGAAVEAGLEQAIATSINAKNAVESIIETTATGVDSTTSPFLAPPSPTFGKLGLFSEGQGRKH